MGDAVGDKSARCRCCLIPSAAVKKCNPLSLIALHRPVTSTTSTKTSAVDHQHHPTQPPDGRASGRFHRHGPAYLQQPGWPDGVAVAWWSTRLAGNRRDFNAFGQLHHAAAAI